LAYNLIGHTPGSSKSSFPRGAAAALQALGLDDGIAEAHLALAEAQLYFHWDWPAAEKSFRQALDINPSLAAAHAHYAWLHLIHGARRARLRRITTRRRARSEATVVDLLAWLASPVARRLRSCGSRPAGSTGHRPEPPGGELRTGTVAVGARPAR
jgi:hypothetical protein